MSDVVETPKQSKGKRGRRMPKAVRARLSQLGKLRWAQKKAAEAARQSVAQGSGEFSRGYKAGYVEGIVAATLSIGGRLGELS